MTVVLVVFMLVFFAMGFTAGWFQHQNSERWKWIKEQWRLEDEATSDGSTT